MKYKEGEEVTVSEILDCGAIVIDDRSTVESKYLRKK